MIVLVKNIYDVLIDAAPILIGLFGINQFKKIESYKLRQEKIENVKTCLFQLLLKIDTVRDSLEFYKGKCENEGIYWEIDGENMMTELLLSELREHVEKTMEEIVKAEHYLPRLKELNYVDFFKGIRTNLYTEEFRFSVLQRGAAIEAIVKQYLIIADEWPTFYQEIENKIKELDKIKI